MKASSNIWSAGEAASFYRNVIGECGPFATDFVCIAARKKYMTEEQKSSLRTGNTCMMEKTILKEFDQEKFLSKLRRIDAGLDFHTDLDGKPMPRSCMVFYMNVNHTDVLKAVHDFKNEMSQWEYELAVSAHREIPARRLKSVQNRLLKSFQDPKNQVKGWIDIDCDIPSFWETPVLDSLGESFPGEEIVQKLVTHLAGMFRLPEETDAPSGEKPVCAVLTHGGFHVLIRQSAISTHNRSVASATEDKILIPSLMHTPEKLRDEIACFLAARGYTEAKEIKINQNSAVPVPGTLQGGFPVRCIWP